MYKYKYTIHITANRKCKRKTGDSAEGKSWVYLGFGKNCISVRVN